MKSCTKYITISTDERIKIVNITDKVINAIKESGINEGFCLVSAMHITSSIFVNDEEPGLKEDIIEWLEKLAPEKDYRHHKTGEDNGSAHLKNLIMHHQVIIPVTKNNFDKGPWQEIFYGEFDGQRNKKILIKIIGE